jgi:uncharacterized membrane protein
VDKEVGAVSHERLRTTLITVAFAGSAASLAFLPGYLPGGFGVPSSAEVWVSRAIAAFVLPIAAALVCVLLERLAAAEPDRANYERFCATFDPALDAAVIFILGLHATLVVTLLLGMQPWLGYVPPLLVGVLVMIVGNALPRVRPNAVVGVCTPWAHRSRRAWAITHRVGGYLLVALGLVIVVSTFFVRTWLGWLVGGGVGVAALLLVVVSWLAWRTEGTP